MNMQLCKVEGRDKLRIEIYERGAGYTLASGTGACAAAATAYRLGLVDRKMTVEMPGGTLEIMIAEDGDIYMTGSVKKVGVFTLEENFFSQQSDIESIRQQADSSLYICLDSGREI